MSFLRIFKRQRPIDSSFPFAMSRVQGRIQINVPSSVLVRVRRGLRWLTVYSGSLLAREGVVLESQNVLLSFRADSRVRVQSGNRHWDISPHTFNEGLSRFSSISLKELRWLGVSVLGHVGLILALLFVVNIPVRRATPIQGTKTSQQEKKAQASAQGMSLPQIIVKPYAGVSYHVFFDKWIDKTGTTSERLSHWLKKLGHVQVSDLKEVKVGAVTGPNAGIAFEGSGDGIGGAALLDLNASDGEASVPRPQEKKLDPKDIERIRNEFAAAQDSLKKAYSAALTVDPTLSVTVAFEVLVGPNGFLQLKNVQTRGKYTPKGLELLRGGIARVFDAINVGKHLAGVTVRGENVFVR